MMSKKGALGWSMLSVTARSGGPEPRFPGPSEAMGFCVKTKAEESASGEEGHICRTDMHEGVIEQASGDVHSRGLDGGRTEIAEDGLGKVRLDCTRVSVQHAHQPS
jgi:hypothetical protein